MEENDRTDQNVNDAKNGQGDSPKGYLRAVFVGGAWAFIALLLTAVFWPNLTERMKFFTSTLWVLVTAFAVIAQAVIYRKQWAIMESSLSRSDTAIELTK